MNTKISVATNARNEIKEELVTESSKKMKESQGKEEIISASNVS